MNRPAIVAVSLLCCLGAADVDAQGVTGAAIQGHVLGPDSAPIEDATVLVTNTANGERWQVQTRTKGRFNFERLSVGGPYRVEVRALGFAPLQRDNVFLALGQRLTADFILQSAAYELEAITVSGAADPLINAGRTGPAQSMDQSTIARLPVTDRDFRQLVVLFPHAVATPAGFSIDGQPDRLNAIQIDGTTANDLLGSSGLGGSQVLGARSVSVEAIKELQVISAPFDVRFGNFAAGLVNAVTQSGTNRIEGSVSAYFADRSLVGKDSEGSRGDDFENKELSGTLGGPIVRDRATFFIDAGLQRPVLPETGPVLRPDGSADLAAKVTYASAARFQDILRKTYGVEPGETGGFPQRRPGQNVFAKLTLQLGVNSRLEVSHDYSHGHFRAVLDRSFEPYSLTSTIFGLPATANATRLAWTTSFGSRYTNELVAARLRQGFRCEAASDFPRIAVTADTRDLVAGSTCLPQIGWSVDLEDQSLLEVTDNLTVAAGAHRLTFGTHDERIRLNTLPPLDYFFGLGWSFSSLDSLEQGLPASYGATLRSPVRPTGPLATPLVNQVGAYAQDQWNPNPRLTITTGLRIDVPFLSRHPVLNSQLLGGPLGFDNTPTPSGKILWSPRMGINYDLKGDGTTYLRGGVGLFAGRPAYKWFAEVDAHTGLEAVYLSCTGRDTVPTFTIDPANQPTTCAGGAIPQTPLVNAFDPNFRFPRNLKISLGVDHEFRSGIVGTLDVLFTGGVNQYDLVDLNLKAPSLANGEGGRAMYGTIDQFGAATPARVDPAFGPVILTRNSSGNRAYSITAQVQKHFANGTELGASYSFARSKDRLSPGSDNTNGDVDFTLLDGTLERRNVRTAAWEVPHRATLLATANLPGQVRFSLFYEIRSGGPFTYGVAGDGNADGYFGDDIAYIPRDARPGGDVSLVVLDTVSGTNVPAPAAVYDSLNQFVQAQSCLRTQRGHIMRRNSCRGPGNTHTEARLAKLIPTFNGHLLELTLDVFNPLHLLDDDWGVVRGSEDRLLELVGYDDANGRGVYRWLGPRRGVVDEGATRWSMQLGARWSF